MEGGENEQFEQAFEVGVMSTARPGDGVKFTGNIDKIRGLQKTKAAAGSVQLLRRQLLFPIARVRQTPASLCRRVVDITPRMRRADWRACMLGTLRLALLCPIGAHLQVSATYKGSGGPGVMVDFDELYRQPSADPAEWRGRKKPESKFSKEMQEKQLGVSLASNTLSCMGSTKHALGSTKHGHADFSALIAPDGRSSCMQLVAMLVGCCLVPAIRGCAGTNRS